MALNNIHDPVLETNNHCAHIELTDCPSKSDRHWHRLQQYCKSVFDLAQFKPLDASPLVNAQSQDEYNQAAVALINRYFCAINHIKVDLHKLSATDRVEVTSHLSEEEESWLKGISTPDQNKQVLAQARKALEKARFSIENIEVTLPEKHQTALHRALDLWLATH